MVNAYVQQGDIIRLESSAIHALVLSRDFFNRSGMAVVCPIFSTLPGDALHIPVSAGQYKGIAAVEQMKSLDLKKRIYTVLTHLDVPQIQNISDAAQGIFDYYPFG